MTNMTGHGTRPGDGGARRGLRGLRGRRAAADVLRGRRAAARRDGELARSITPPVAEADGADHQMFVPGGLAASAAVLGDVMTAVERFLDEVAWTGVS